MPNPVQTAKATLHWEFEGKRAASVFHHELPPGADLSDLEQITDDWLYLWSGATGGYTHWRNQVVEDLVLASITAEDLDPAGAGETERTVGTAGTQTDPPLPYGCAAVISWKTAVRSRRTRGRTFVFGFSTGAVDGDSAGTWDVGVQTDLQGLAQGAIDLHELHGNPMVVASYKFGTKQAITSASVDRQVDTIRRRNRLR